MKPGLNRRSFLAAIAAVPLACARLTSAPRQGVVSRSTRKIPLLIDEWQVVELTEVLPPDVVTFLEHLNEELMLSLMWGAGRVLPADPR